MKKNQVFNNLKFAEKKFQKGFQVNLEFKDLPYGENALSSVIDAETMKIHHDKHHKKYFDNLINALQKTDYKNKSVNEILFNLEKLPENIRETVRNNGGGHYNHEFFWNLMSPKPKTEPTGKLKDAIINKYESLDNFKQKFLEAGLNRFGSGWIWLCVNGEELKITAMPYQDNPIIEKCGTPLIGCDVWEHAYYLNYKNDREAYLNSWFKILNWEFVENIFEEK